MAFRDKIKFRSAKQNMSSAGEQQEVVSLYLDQELKANHIALVGSQEKAQDLGVHVSPFGVIPKKGKANKWRLILDLSLPTGQSVNNGISKEDCSFSWPGSSKDRRARKRYFNGKNGQTASLPEHSGGSGG